MRRLCSNNLSHEGSTGLLWVAPPSYKGQVCAVKVLSSSVSRAGACSLSLATAIPQSLHSSQAQQPIPSVAVIPGYRSSVKVASAHLAPPSRPTEPPGPYSRPNLFAPQSSTPSARALVSIMPRSVPTASQPTAMTPYSAAYAAFSELQSAVTNEEDPVLRATFRTIIQGYMSTGSTQPLSELEIRQQIKFLAQCSRANINLRTHFVQQRRNLPSVEQLQSVVSADIFTTRDDPMARYEIGQQIGRGGFGSVSIGVRRLIRTGSVTSLCAIKTVVGRATSVSNTERELLIALAAQPNFLRYFTYQVDQFPQAQTRIVMEYVHGCDIRQWMYLYNPFDNTLIRHIAKEALTGLAYLHDTVQAVHRDISTTNIIMDVMCRVKIIDMGCALRLDARSLATEPTRSHRNLFNVGIEYLRAPEALAHRGWYFVSDIWSLGMVLLFVLWPNSHKLVSDQNAKSLASKLLQYLPALTQTGQMGQVLSMMLTTNEFQRPSAQTLLGHPWFAYS